MSKLYKGEKSSILSALTFNDGAFWGADMFAGVVFALYITQNIPGGSAIHVGLVFGLYRLIRAITAIPIGRFLDKHRGHLDEYYTLMTAGGITGLVYITLFFATELWHVYLGISFIAIGHALNIGAWNVLFYGNVSEEIRGQAIGTYQMFTQIIYGLAIIIAGFVGEIFGFEWTLLFAGIVTLLSSLIMWFIYGSRNKM